jgi:hypothetical protein
MPDLKRISATRIVATPAALDAAMWPSEALALRLAPDEMLVTATVTSDMIDDPYAIVEPDGGFAGAWLPAGEALEILERTCEWELPHQRPSFAQGAVAGLPVKLWLEEERILIMVPAPYAYDLKERMA